MNFRYLSLILYLVAIAVFLMLAKGNMTVVGIFLLFFNSMVVPGVFAGIAAKRYGVRLDDEGRKLSGWVANTSSVITLVILFGSYKQIGQYLTPVEIAVLFAVYVLFVFGFRYLVAFLFNHYLDQFNSDS